MGNSSSIQTKKYTWKTTAEEVAKDFTTQCQGKYVIVTGANCGLGLETVRVLAKYGAHVTLCTRSLKNGEEALAIIRKENPNANIKIRQLDLGDLKSIQTFVNGIMTENEPVHVLINNAGVMACPKSYTKDGFETQFGVNHLGHFYLTNLLLPRLENSGKKDEPARVINVSSMGNWIFAPNEGIDFTNLDGKKKYDPWVKYGEAKLANILFTKELNKRIQTEGKHVMSVSLHPGAILETNLARHFNFQRTMVMLSNIFTRRGGASVAFGENYKNIPQGAATQVMVSLDPNIVPGEHYADCALNTLVHPMGYDSNLACELWRRSEELINAAVESN